MYSLVFTVLLPCIFQSFLRDRSACLSQLRVPKPGGREGELVDDWLEHYFLREGDKEFPVRNEQVRK